MTRGTETMEPLRDPYPPNPPPGQDELPYCDGEPMDTRRHRQQMNLLITTLRDRFPDRPELFVDGNMFVYFSELQSRKNDFRGPDVFVVLRAKVGRERKSWVVWEEDGRLPDVVIELTSPSTEHVDRGEKKDLYERVWHLPEYFVYDPWTQAFEGWRLTEGCFVPVEPNPDGSLDCRVLGLALRIVEGRYENEDAPWLRWIDPRDGRVLPTGEERADHERRRADDEKRRADDEKKRADDEKKRADDEKKRADELDAQVAELTRRLAGGDR